MATDIPAGRPVDAEGWAHLAELTADPYIPETDDAPEPHGIARLDVPTDVLKAELAAMRRLPLDDPDRHALDPIDTALYHDAAVHPEHVTEKGDGRG